MKALLNEEKLTDWQIDRVLSILDNSSSEDLDITTGVT